MIDRRFAPPTLYLEIDGHDRSGPSWSQADFESEIASPAARVFHHGPVDESPEGFVFFRDLGGTEIEIMHLAVRQKGQGRGQALIEAFLRHLSRTYPQTERLFLEVSDKNRAARELYERNGFKVSSNRKNYYRDGSDALLMSLTLKGSTTS